MSEESMDNQPMHEVNQERTRFRIPSFANLCIQVFVTNWRMRVTRGDFHRGIQVGPIRVAINW